MSMGGTWLRGVVFATCVAIAPLHATAQTQVPAGAATRQVQPADTRRVLPEAAMTIQSAIVPGLVGQPESRVSDVLGPRHLVKGSTSSQDSDRPAGTVLSQDPQSGSRVPLGTRVDLVVSKGPREQSEPIRVPDVVGNPVAVGQMLLARAHLRVGNVGREAASAANGTILRQDPRAGASIGQGGSVDLVVSSGPGATIEQTRVPDVVGRPLDDAQSALRDAALQLGRVTRQANAASSGTVLRQSPSARSVVASGSSVTLIVSAGSSDAGSTTTTTPPPPDGRVRVPNVVDHPFPDGDTPAILREATLHYGVVVREDSRAPFGTILRQIPAAGALVNRGSGVDLVVSRGPAAAPTPTVPDVVGLPAPSASQRISEARFTANERRVAGVRPEGIVVAQRPVGGTPASPGSGVAIEVSDGSRVVVPRVVGRSAATADEAIVRTGLRPEHTTRASGATPDTVISQQPAAGAIVARETTVALVVAIAPAVVVPDAADPPAGSDTTAPPADTPGATGVAGVAGDPAPIETQKVGTTPAESQPGPVVAHADGVPPSNGTSWSRVTTTVVAVVVLLLGAATAALWPPVRYRVLVKNHKVSASTDSLEIEGPTLEMRVRVEHGGSTLNEEPEGAPS